jgi:hypothetical protein
MPARDQLPYNTRNMENFGIERGTGIRGKTGKKKGGFSDQASSSKKSTAKPPRKMN